MYVADKNYYPESFNGGHSLVDTSTPDGEGNYIETHEFYDNRGLVVFKWKIKKNSDGDVLDWRVKWYGTDDAATPASTYVSFDDLT